MANEIAWEALKAGKGCPLDYPRDNYNAFSFFVRKLPTSSLYLARNQAYRGRSTLVYDERHVTRIDELSNAEWIAFAGDLRVAEAGLFRAFEPDHMNVESLGNVMPHMHWHLIPRYKGDPRWGGPVWTTSEEEMPDVRLKDSEYEALAVAVNREIDALVGDRERHP